MLLIDCSVLQIQFLRCAFTIQYIYKSVVTPVQSNAIQFNKCVSILLYIILI